MCGVCTCLCFQVSTVAITGVVPQVMYNGPYPTTKLEDGAHGGYWRVSAFSFWCQHFLFGVSILPIMHCGSAHGYPLHRGHSTAVHICSPPHIGRSPPHTGCIDIYCAVVVCVMEQRTRGRRGNVGAVARCVATPCNTVRSCMQLPCVL